MSGCCLPNLLLFTFSDSFQFSSIWQAFVKSSNPAFNPTKHPYELSLTTATEVTEVQDGLATDVPSVQFDYVSIGDVQNKPENELVDIIGICSGWEKLSKKWNTMVLVVATDTRDLKWIL